MFKQSAGVSGVGSQWVWDSAVWYAWYCMVSCLHL